MSELHYPFENTPVPGEWQPVADGIYWLRMSLPMALDHINLYVLEDAEGWWIIDTGMGLDGTQQAWNTLFDGPMKGKPVIGVIVTHMHPDHVGQAGWLCEKWRAPLYMSFGEYYNARTFSTMPFEKVPWTTREYFIGAGVEQDYMDKMRAKMRGFGSIIEPMPLAYHRLSEGDCLSIGGREWRVMIGSGHSPEHVCLFNERDNLLFSGDQIIPRITSNISVMPSEPKDNPLKRWMASLDRFEADLPAETLVFPAHNTPFTGVHKRLQYLREHHEDHLQAVEEACLTPRTAVQLLPVLFSRELELTQMNLALGEAIAHINYLLAAGRVSRSTDSNGVHWYKTESPEAAVRAGCTSHHKDTAPLEV